MDLYSKMGFLYEDNWTPGKYYYVIIFCMILFQVIIIIWNILISSKIFSSFDDSSNIVAGAMTSGADVRFASRPSSDYPTKRVGDGKCCCVSGYKGAKSRFLGHGGMSEPPVLWDIGDVRMTEDMQTGIANEGLEDNIQGTFAPRWNSGFSDEQLASLK